MNSVLKDDLKLFADNFPLAHELNDIVIAVTGATGLLGSCMVRCLLSLNERYDLHLKVVAVIRNEAKAREMFGEESESLKYIAYDFSSSEPFNPGIKIDCLVHFASPTASKYFVEHPVETMHVALGGTEKVLRYAADNDLKSLVYVSSLEVYGTVTDDSHPLTEDQQGYLDVLSARSSYPMAKRAAECLCHAYSEEYGVNVCIGRLAQTFGAGVDKDDNRVFAQFARSITTGDDIVLHTKGELCRSYCYTTDAVSALIYIMLHGDKGEAYNVANEETYTSIIDMANYLTKEFNPEVKVKIQFADGMGYSPSTKLRLSANKINQLGWHPQFDKHAMFDRLIRSFKD